MCEPHLLWDASGGFADQLDVAKNGILYQLIGIECLAVETYAIADGTLGKPTHVLGI